MSIPKAPSLELGQKVQISGQYAVVGPKGGKTCTLVTVRKGKTLLPTRKPGLVFVHVDKTKSAKLAANSYI